MVCDGLCRQSMGGTALPISITYPTYTARYHNFIFEGHRSRALS
jgi:hypothetical protein